MLLGLRVRGLPDDDRVVDDAIIIGEAAYAETEKHGYTLENIVRGAQRVAVPATFGVLTTIVAFLPLVFQTGRTAAFAGAIGWVVVFCLLYTSPSPRDTA